MPKSLSVKNIPNLCRKLAHRYMQAFYTDWVYKVFWHFLKMYPICVECLHIGICKHSTQIGYIRLTPIPFLHKLGTFSKMCPICVECLRIILNFKQGKEPSQSLRSQISNPVEFRLVATKISKKKPVIFWKGVLSPVI